MQNQKQFQIYNEKLDFNKENFIKAKKNNGLFTLLRGITFLAGIFFSIILYKTGLIFCFGSIFFFLTIFLILVKKNIEIQDKMKYFKELISIYEKEIKGLNYDFSAFDAGSEFINPNHKFSYDLDIFGENSIFQMINRACTFRGKNLLASWFNEPLKESVNAETKQKASQFLREQLDWRMNFLCLGNLYKDDFNDDSKLKNLREKSEYFYNKLLFKLIIYLLPLITVSVLLAVIFNILPIGIFGIFYVIQFAIIGFNVKKSNEIYMKVSKKVKLFFKYELLLKEIEKLNTNDLLINSLKEKIKTNNHTASIQIEKLKNLAKGFDNRLNLLVLLFGQGIFLFDLQYAYRIEKWLSENNQSIENWINVIGEIDALISISNFSFNNSDFTNPEILRNEKFGFEFHKAGHPLIHYEKRICNDYNISKEAFISIVTGANMAGKSTFLRTVGVNLILGMIGSVVCAENMKFTPIKIFTSVRTNDSVQKSESYFFAELKRLKLIIDELKSGNQLFVIIDEMLRGTNSKDKHLGSEAIIKRLFSLNSVGIVATHDIDLGKLATEFPENVQNKRFEVDIKNDELFFDYTIKDGISQNLNAIFLMKKMEIIS